MESTSFRGGKGGMSKAWQQALISTTIFAWAEFLPTENCHSGELCTGGLIVGLRGGAPRGKHGILLHNLLLLPLYLSRPFLANSLSFLYAGEISRHFHLNEAKLYAEIVFQHLLIVFIKKCEFIRYFLNKSKTSI